MNLPTYDVLTDRFGSSAAPPFQPVTICVHVGYACNLSCDYCINQVAVSNPLEPEELVRQLGRWERLRVVLSGGEPMMYPERTVALAQGLARDGHFVMMSTNGTLAQPEGLLELCDWIDVSIPGSTRGGYEAVRGFDGFDVSVAFVRAAVNRGSRVRLSYLVHPRNAHEVTRLPDLVEGLGVAGLRVGYLWGADDPPMDVAYLVESALREIAQSFPDLPVYAPLDEAGRALFESGYILVDPSGGIHTYGCDTGSPTARISMTRETLDQLLCGAYDANWRLFCND